MADGANVRGTMALTNVALVDAYKPNPVPLFLLTAVVENGKITILEWGTAPK